jgi:arylsulfatase A-like enzyme
MHIVDWYPTLLKMAGADLTYPKQPHELDGFDFWPTISNGAKSPRKQMLYNVYPNMGGAIRVDNWKLIRGFNCSSNFNCLWSRYYNDSNSKTVLTDPPGINASAITSEHAMLFDLESDPNETTNMASSHPDIVVNLEKKLQMYGDQQAPTQQSAFNSLANPKLHGGAWEPWCDVDIASSASNLSPWWIYK